MVFSNKACWWVSFWHIWNFCSFHLRPKHRDSTFVHYSLEGGRKLLFSKVQLQSPKCRGNCSLLNPTYSSSYTAVLRSPKNQILTCTELFSQSCLAAFVTWQNLCNMLLFSEYLKAKYVIWHCDFVEPRIDTSYIIRHFLGFSCCINWILNATKMLLLSPRIWLLDLLILLLRTIYLLLHTRKKMHLLENLRTVCCNWGRCSSATTTANN